MFDFLKKPETVILKDTSESRAYLEELKKLEPKEEVQKEIELMEKQIRLEDKILSELKNGHQNFVVLKNINFSVEDVNVHLDYYVITARLIFIIECKPWNNPLQRAEESAKLLRDRKVMNADGMAAITLQSSFFDFFRVVVVSEDPEDCKAQWTKAEEPWIHVLKPEQLVPTMEKWNRSTKLRKLSKKRLLDNGKKMMDTYTTEPFIYQERLGELLQKLEGRDPQAEAEAKEKAKDDMFVFSGPTA